MAVQFFDALLPTCCCPQDEKTSAKKYYDITYVEGSTNYKHTLDIYTPPAATTEISSISKHERSPVVLYIHGGGWILGDKRSPMSFSIGPRVAAQGFVVVVPSYRLSNWSKQYHALVFLIFNILFNICLYLLGVLCLPTVAFEWIKSGICDNWWLYLIVTITFLSIIQYAIFRHSNVTVRHPDHVDDVAMAFKWVYDNIPYYGGDTSQIFLMGHSAGAHLISLLSLDGDYLSRVGVNTTSIAGVIAISGVYNIGRLRKLPFARKMFIHPVFDEAASKDALYACSPLTHVRKTSFPFLLMNAGYDMHLQRDTEEFKGALNRVGVDVSTHVIPWRTHDTIMLCMDMTLMKEWIDSVILH